MDVLFLHVPKFNNYYKPIGRFSFVLFPPIGLIGLADFLRKNGRDSTIVHLGVERQKYGELHLEKIIEKYQSDIVGLDLHWHFQSFDVIEVARTIKLKNADTAILLGGFTASIFAEEIIRDYDCVDFVIRGDGELPLLKLIDQYQSEKQYHLVPNLTYRSKGKVVTNPTSFVADSSLIDSICYTDFTLMKDYDLFVDSFSRYLNISDLSEQTQRFFLGRDRGYQVYIGRGCIHGCSFCGGSKESHETICSRRAPVLRSVEQILASIQDLENFGFNGVCLALDSVPRANADDYYVAIFNGIRDRALSLNIEVELYYLPSLRFLQAFRELPGKDSFLTISPHSPNERLRKKNSLYRYSNVELEHSLDMMDHARVNCLLCFTCGLPFETLMDLKEMSDYQRSVRRRYKRVRSKTSMIEIEPGSAMSKYPDRYGIHPLRITFEDYYKYHSRPSQNHWLEMGYDRDDCPSHAQVSHYFCRHFCERFKLSWLSPVFCNIVSVIRKIGFFKLFDKIISLQSRH